MVERAKPLLGKVKLAGILRAVTGLHIGASKEVLDIGALDLPVVRDPASREPYIPGSSLKGKLRSLFEREMAYEVVPTDPASFFNRRVGDARIHVCNDVDKAYDCSICRLFGSSGDREHAGSNFPARLRVRDAFFTDYTRDDLEEVETGALYTEIKFENVLHRVTAAATPRQIERVLPGSDFMFELIYDVEQNSQQLAEDLKNLFFLLELLEDDALGGHGSRGSGKVRLYIHTLLGKKVEAYRQDGDEGLKKVIDLPTPSGKEDVEKLPRLWQVRAKVQEIVDLFDPLAELLVDTTKR